jgi:hypothetical protein
VGQGTRIRVRLKTYRVLSKKPELSSLLKMAGDPESVCALADNQSGFYELLDTSRCERFLGQQIQPELAEAKAPSRQKSLIPKADLAETLGGQTLE